MIKFGTSGWRAVMGEEFTFGNVRIVVQAVANYLKALVDLYRLEGSLLARRGISAPGTQPVTLDSQKQPGR